MSGISQYIAKPRSIEEISDSANALRKALEIREGEQFPIVEFLEIILPSIDEAFSLEVVESDIMPDRYGVTYPQKHTIVIREDVYYGATENNRNDLITLAHELCHYLFHDEPEFSLARTIYGDDIPETYCPEWQADTFADKLLWPSKVKGLKLFSKHSKKVL